MTGQSPSQSKGKEGGGGGGVGLQALGAAGTVFKLIASMFLLIQLDLP